MSFMAHDIEKMVIVLICGMHYFFTQNTTLKVAKRRMDINNPLVETSSYL